MELSIHFINWVSIAGAILGGGLQIVENETIKFGDGFQSRGRFLGVGYDYPIAIFKQHFGFNRGGDSWGWATIVTP